MWRDLEINKIMTYKTKIKKLKGNLFRETEMRQHYQELFETSVGEMKFNNLQKEHYNTLLDEVEVLLEKKVKHTLIKAVIENGKQRAVLDQSIHFDTICGIEGFKNNK